MIDRKPAHLLGRHVAHRSHHGSGLRVAGDGRPARRLARSHRLDSLRQAEIENLDVVVLRHEHVLGLQIAVEDPPFVGGGEALRNLKGVVDRLVLGNRSGVELAAQSLSFQKLHDGVGDAAVVAEVVDREDVRMRKRRDRLRLSLEPGERLRVAGDRGGQNLDRDVAVELRVPSPVDLAHPARAERGQNLVGPESSARGEGHRLAEITPRLLAYFAPAISFWNRGFLRSGSKLGSISSQPGER